MFQLLKQTITPSLPSPLSLFYSLLSLFFVQSIQDGVATSHGNTNFFAAHTKRKRIKRINKVQELKK
jgi:hypothetical protein